MQRWVFLISILASICVHGWEVKCPWGCADEEEDPLIRNIGKLFANCIYRYDFRGPFPICYSLNGVIYHFKWSVLEEEFSNTHGDFIVYSFTHDVEREKGFERVSERPNGIDLRKYDSFLKAYFDLSRDATLYKEYSITDWREMAAEEKQKKVQFQQKVDYYKCQLLGSSEGNKEWLLEKIADNQDEVKFCTHNIERLLGYIPEIETTFAAISAKNEATKSKIENLYIKMYDYCIRNHQWRGAFYERGLFNFYHGQVTEALDDISAFLESAKKDNVENLLPSEAYLNAGIIESEAGLYNNAILSLNQAIDKDPTNKDAYFERAVAYFETGEFDLALKDYLATGFKNDVEAQSFSLDYASGLVKGMRKGIEQEFGDALPAWAPMMNIGLWALMNSPSPSAKFITATLGCVAAVGVALTGDQMVTELKELVTNWDQLSQQQKGELTGFIIGKYGIDIFVAYGSTKCMETYGALKKANNALTFEMALADEANVGIVKAKYQGVQKYKKDQEYIQKTFGKTPYLEAEIKENLQKMGYKTFARPEGIKDSFITRYSDKGCGICYHDPLNPTHEYVRVMPGNIHSPNPAQQQPYVMHMRNGRALNIEGKEVPKRSPEAHISVEQYVYRVPE